MGSYHPNTLFITHYPLIPCLHRNPPAVVKAEAPSFLNNSVVSLATQEGTQGEGGKKGKEKSIALHEQGLGLLFYEDSVNASGHYST